MFNNNFFVNDIVKCYETSLNLIFYRLSSKDSCLNCCSNVQESEKCKKMFEVFVEMISICSLNLRLGEKNTHRSRIDVSGSTQGLSQFSRLYRVFNLFCRFS